MTFTALLLSRRRSLLKRNSSVVMKLMDSIAHNVQDISSQSHRGRMAEIMTRSQRVLRPYCMDHVCLYVCKSVFVCFIFLWRSGFWEIFSILFLLFCFFLFLITGLWWRRILCRLYSFKLFLKEQIMRAKKKQIMLFYFHFGHLRSFLHHFLFYFFLDKL